MQTIIFRIILNEESHDLQLSAPTLFAALREHKELFCFIPERDIKHFDSNQPWYGMGNKLFATNLFVSKLTCNKVAG